MKRASLLIFLAALLLTACAGPAVQKGNYVQVVYTGTYANGTIFDTNDPALQSVFPAPEEHFKPLTVRVGRNEVVPGFENALMGMHQGEKKSVTIKAKDAYGTYDASKLVSVPKIITFPKEVTLQRTVATPKDEFLAKAKRKNVTVGETFESTNFWYNVTAINKTDVTLYLVNATKDPVTFETSLWNSSLHRTTPTNITYVHNAMNGATYNTKNGPYRAEVNATAIVLRSLFELGQQFKTEQGVVRVTADSGQTITLDFNPVLAGQDLTFNITVTEIQQK